jgi:hypothetical protein
MGHDARCDGCNERIPEVPGKPFDPVSRRNTVTIDKRDELRRDSFDPGVARGRRTAVRPTPDQPRTMPCHHGGDSIGVGRAVVDHDDTDLVTEALQAAAQLGGSAVRRYDDGDVESGCAKRPRMSEPGVRQPPREGG